MPTLRTVATVIPITRADPAKLPPALPRHELPLPVTELAPTGLRPLVLCRLPHAVLFRPALGWAAQWARRAPHDGELLDAGQLDAGVPVDA